MPATESCAASRRWLAVAGALLALALGCTRRLEPTRGVLVLSLDTLRADRLGCYGNGRDTSPFLDALAARGVLFEELIAQYPSTLTSHMSIFTGLYPREHGVFPPDGKLAEAIPTLPEIFQRAGYRTAGFTESGLMRGSYGFSRGFDVFDDQAENRFDDLERTLARGLGFLRSLEGDDRFFLFLHTYAIHTPYDPPPPYDSMYWSGEPPQVFRPIARNFQRLNSHKETLDPAAVEYFLALYDGSIRYVDDRLASFFGELDALGIADDLTVVVTSDHGEEFLEHGQLAHAQIYRETVHVPLIVVHPGLQSARRVARVVETVDLAPTLIELAGLPSPEMSGRSLYPDLAGAESAPRGDGYSEVSIAGIVSESLHHRDSGGTFQAVRSRLDATQPRERIVTFDVGPAALELRLTSFLGRPRRVDVRIDGAPHGSVGLDGQEETRVVLPAAPATPRRRIRLEADSCTPREGRRPYIDCYSFFLSAPGPLERLELFELGSDPLAQRDVWSARSAIGRSMLATLSALRWRPRASSADLALDDEARRRLEALGYL